MRRATAVVERWIDSIGADGWLRGGNTVWNNKDLLGHLTAWSDLLIDEVEAVRQGRSETIQAVDVDTWNADQVAARTNCSPETIVREWRRSARRAGDVLERLPARAWSATGRVPWTDQPIGVAELARLWLVHIEQHRARLVDTGT